MNYNNPIPEKTVGVVRYSCGFLFLVFCFTYLYFLVGDSLANAQHIFSKGMTHYSVPIGAGVLTILLQTLQWLIARFVRLTNMRYAATYVPSFIVLAMLSDLFNNTQGEYIWGIWKWLVPTLLVAWIIWLFVIKAIDDERSMNVSILAMLGPNYFILFACVVACGFAPGATSLQYCEMKAERMLLEKDYEQAAAIGIDAWESSERLTQLRMYALSKQGMLGDSIFCYPQEYGVKGLIDIDDTISSRRFPMRNIEQSLGAFCGQTISSSKRFLERLCEDSVATEQGLQYLLCYHLLDRNLKHFNKQFNHVYGDTINTVLPRAYQEAIVMQHPEFKTDSLPIYINKVYVKAYNDYKCMRDTITDKLAMRNLTRRMYGHSYWWYYDNPR